jgi:predicted DNA-binding transcriptional regulator AlpA
MKRNTAAAYLDLSVNSLLREVRAGRLPQPISIGGRDHWRKDALDKAIDNLDGLQNADSGEPAALKELRKRYGQAA